MCGEGEGESTTSVFYAAAAAATVAAGRAGFVFALALFNLYDGDALLLLLPLLLR